MKLSKWFALSILMIMTLLLTFSQTIAKFSYEVYPNQITVSAERGEKITRVISLQVDRDIDKIQYLLPDLSTTDGQSFLPSNNFQIALPNGPFKAGEFINIPVMIDFESARSGKYSGQLILSLNSENSVVPIVITIRDNWLLPGITLFLGVCLSLLLSIYQKEGRPRDLVLVQVSRLRSQIRSEHSLDAHFMQKIESALLDVDFCLQAEKYDQANNAISLAENWWTCWRKNREDWIVLFNHANDLENELKDSKFVDHQVPVIVNIQDDLQDLMRRDEYLQNPIKFHEILKLLRSKYQDFLELNQEVNQIELIIYSTMDEKNIEKLKKLRLKVDQMAGNWDETKKEIQTEIDSLIKTQSFTGTYGISPANNLSKCPPILTQVPNIVSHSNDALTTKAKISLTTFRIVTYGVIVIMFSGLGFNQLYWANISFGANPWSDYLSLILWGFGIQASGATITDLFKGIDLKLWPKN